MKMQENDITLSELVAHVVPHWTVESAAAGYLSRKTGMTAANTDAGTGLWAHVKAACAPAEDTLIAVAPTVAIMDSESRGMLHVNKNCSVDADIYPDGSIHILTDETFR